MDNLVDYLQSLKMRLNKLDARAPVRHPKSGGHRSSDARPHMPAHKLYNPVQYMKHRESGAKHPLDKRKIFEEKPREELEREDQSMQEQQLEDKTMKVLHYMMHYYSNLKYKRILQVEPDKEYTMTVGDIWFSFSKMDSENIILKNILTDTQMQFHLKQMIFLFSYHDYMKDGSYSVYYDDDQEIQRKLLVESHKHSRDVLENDWLKQASSFLKCMLVCLCIYGTFDENPLLIIRAALHKKKPSVNPAKIKIWLCLWCNCYEPSENVNGLDNPCLKLIDMAYYFKIKRSKSMVQEMFQEDFSDEFKQIYDINEDMSVYDWAAGVLSADTSAADILPVNES
jgi:hypothetical protein